MRMLVCVLACGLLTGCATRSGPPSDGAETRSAKPVRVALRQEARVTLGEAVRQLGREAGGSAVLMHGIEDKVVGPFDFRRATHRTVMEALAEAEGCLVQVGPDYTFVHPPAYGLLCDVSTAGLLDPAYAGLEAALAFRAGTPLFSVFAPLSQALAITVVADDAVGDATCGELVLDEMPLASALDAVLKSARVAPNAFHVDSTAEYILVRAAGNVHPAELLLNAGTLTPAQYARLDARVDVVLPAPQADAAHLRVPGRPAPLRDVLNVLSAQLGVEIRAESALLEFPVNPVVFTNVRVRTAIDLLIRQWLVPEFGYVFLDDSVLIKRLSSELPKEPAEPAPEAEPPPAE